MKKGYYALPALTALLCALIAAGCGSEAEPAGKTAKPENTQESGAEETFSETETEPVETLEDDGPDIPWAEEPSSVLESEAPVLEALYTDEELCRMVMGYYYAESGYAPEVAEIDSREGNDATVHLYDIVPDQDGQSHTATAGWFTINDRTGQGENQIMGDIIDFTPFLTAGEEEN